MKSDFFEFAAIYHCSIVLSELPAMVVDPVKLEFFSGPKNFVVSLESSSVTTRSQQFELRSEVLGVPEGKYFSLTARTKEKNPTRARVFCEVAIDRAVMNLSMSTTSAIFESCIYRGWLVSKHNEIREGWARVVEPVLFNSSVQTEWLRLQSMQKISNDNKHKIDLMAKYYSKALSVLPGEERFLYLWTILEIWPMSGTSDIRNISDLLGKFVSRDPVYVKEKLAIGKFYGVRSKLLHDGLFPIPLADIGSSFELLQAICEEVMRALNGFGYSGALDKYIN